MNTLDLGRVGIWAGELDRCPAPVLREAAAAVEDLGFPALWFPETTGREAMAQAALLLASTRRTVVATGAAGIYARDAITTVAAQRTLAEAFPGRFLLGLGVGHPTLVTDVRGHRFGPPVATMRAYLDAMDAAPFGPPVPAPPRVLAALGPKMLQLAAGRAQGAHPLGMPVEHTRRARSLLGPRALLAVTQLVVLDASRARAADLARAPAAAALPNRLALLRDLGFHDAESLDGRLVDALVATGGPEDVARRVEEHLDAGADHVSLHVLTTTPDEPPSRQWRELAARLL
ncbi:TIGR03620 family F420-dependent LLM class oxidoreductase [Nonomuraea sp. MG754425]|uniref:TIGR03620 family F420-dependent LLM class oxidoreductase n=1 Tax=Nonomuraea sp. MG754425 TaxID=2570319 RepID=UPI001EFF7CD9|nr:TIGR03620 family F420-dependent LLM class oxidoreductase [Nonomuraea sp. MG754425]MCF6468381.1 TIGR03620 family F420-dependent LLM class oxidoreductase [Nonomuraea sp. MG754425]